jgi:hypothetical protein
MDIVEAWRRSRLGRCACTRCHYCDRELDVHQHDHYPIPKRAGGTRVVATCLVCHDLKDRIPLKFWELNAMHQAFDELLRDKIPELRHLPWPQALASLDGSLPDLERRWVELSPLARVLLAKLRSVYIDETFLDRPEQAPGPV